METKAKMTQMLVLTDKNVYKGDLYKHCQWSERKLVVYNEERDNFRGEIKCDF